MTEKKEERPIYKMWWFWAIVAVLIVACVAIIIVAMPTKKEKEYIAPDELSSKIEKDRQDAIAQQRASTLEIVKATKEAVVAYKELNGYYPASLSDIPDWPETGAVTYSYNEAGVPTLSYYLDGELVEEPVE